MTRIGDTVSRLLRYDDKGGRCKRRGCPNEAPRVILGGRVIALPCQAHQEEQQREEDAANLAKRRIYYMLDSGMTKRLSSLSFDTFRERCGDEDGLKALALAEQWVADYKARRGVSNLVLVGRSGTGKTGLAWSIVRSLCEDGYEARLVNFAHLLEEMKACYAQRIPATQAADAHRVPVLALDDLGVEKPTPWACAQLYEIIDLRYERGLPTIFVSNYPPGKLSARLGRDDSVIGERIVSRMIERATKVEFRGGDRRVAA